MRWILVPLCLFFPLFAQDPSSTDLLQRIRVQMLRNLQEQPNYTCAETIERYYRSGPSRKFQMQDTLRLEVALVEGKEMYAFPGAKNFDAVPLDEMVGDTGAISNGDFALHARSIFGTQGAMFEFKGPAAEGNHDVRFDYDIALKVSRFELKHGLNRAITAYHGFFEADSTTLDIQRISVIADEIPPAIGFKKTIKNLTFARIKIGDGTFLLPAESEMTIVEYSNAENLNRSKFSACRQFTGESVLSFEDPSSVNTTASAPINEVSIPSDIDLALSLNAIDARKAAIGDPVTARLISDAKIRSRLIVPKNAIARGRVTRAEQRQNYVLLGIELMEIEWPGAHAVLHAKLTGFPDRPAPRQILMVESVRPREGLLQLKSTQMSLPQGYLTFWTTTP